ncbi:neuronal pentraxin-1-like [Panulirus ornatus]|uniref:neuronal pentraxin-1-like n=1 Tax=Panulirus ornatus TaxID=150431 RepID=UPI003A879705
MVWFNGESQIREEDVANWDPPPETWIHFCHVFSSSTFTIYTQGQEIFSKDLMSGWSLQLNGSLVLGQEQDALGGGFDIAQVMIGDIAQVSFWDRPLTIPEIVEMATCRTLGRGNVFSSDTASLEVYGSTVQWVNVETLCRCSCYIT